MVSHQGPKRGILSSTKAMASTSTAYVNYCLSQLWRRTMTILPYHIQNI
ncbi:hypothetical protein NC652_002659 [Populus alba x Populus x berolinensis]|uniref:Uncharacterized protein n=1 Tax=Populus alba x Populus x berolinensis TaxID=444605 RepID=A0AAD6RPI4_9ROSI|nr:hypothetical protein NC652_002659 [Populus alba x Populus x berolinensis]KAJ7012779.1 hypothetical protein NC653_002735 [Populus alba x Populus x berolinensis]